MTIKDTLRNNFPKTIDKEGEVFSALVANDNGTAAIEASLTDIIDYMNSWTSNPNVYKQKDIMFQKSLKFFSYLEQFTDEKDEATALRLKAIFIRNHDQVWGTPNNIINVFKQYFPSAEIFFMENTNNFNEDNLIKNGDVQISESRAWVLINAEISTKARFSNSYGIELNNNGSAKQSVKLNVNPILYTVLENDSYNKIATKYYSSEQYADYIRNYKENPSEIKKDDEIEIPVRNSHFLHFFLNGSVNVVIHDKDNNKYWNNISKKWITNKVSDLFSSTEWKPFNLYFISDYTTENIEVSFEAVKDETFIDYIALYKKEYNSSFTIIAHFEGNSIVSATSLAPGKEDPFSDKEHHFTDDERYKRVNYYDQTYLTGVQAGYAKDIYQDLVNYLHATGVRSYIEIINREYVEKQGD